MKTKALILLLALTGLAGCVYPYEMKTDSQAGMFVVEGDINIGSVSTFSLSYAIGLEDFAYSVKPSATVWVEGEDGSRYDSIEPAKSRGNFSIDMTDAPDNCRYRVVIINHDSDKKYLSKWEDVHTPPVVDSVTWKITADRMNMNFFLSFHSEKESEKYFRWNYREDWQYRAPIQALYYYVKPTLSDKEIAKILNNEAAEKIPSEVYGQILPFDEEHPSTYFCYDYYESKDIMLATTEDLTTNRIVDKQYESVGYNSTRTCYHYRTTINIQSMSRDSYQYWMNILQNSKNTGSLDSPVPSQMVGNVYNEDDPDELVIGYVNASKIAAYPVYMSFYDTYFFRYGGNIISDTPSIAMEEWYNAYRIGLLPVGIMGYNSPTEPVYGWAPSKCVLCEYWMTNGHANKKPADWPEKWPLKN